MSRTGFVTILALLALPLVVGCAGTSQAPTEDAEAAMAFEAPDDKGVVYLYRLGRAVGAANVSIVKVNNTVSFSVEENNSIEILLCTEGDAVIKDKAATHEVRIEPGVSVLVPAAVPGYTVEGIATLYRASIPRDFS